VRVDAVQAISMDDIAFRDDVTVGHPDSSRAPGVPATSFGEFRPTGPLTRRRLPETTCVPEGAALSSSHLLPLANSLPAADV
jgi:hypothetical protein